MNPIQMLKGWVTLGEAAAYITEKAKAQVIEPDILELAAQGKLRLSVRFCGAGTKGTVAGAYTDPESDYYYPGRVDYVSAPLLFELNGVFDLIAKAPTDCGDLIGVVRVNEAGEIESLIGGLEVETDTQGRLLRLPCKKLPPTAQWVMRPAAVLDFCGELAGEEREIEELRRMAEFDRSAKEAAILRAEQAEAEAAELRRKLEQERAAQQAAESRAEDEPKRSHLLAIAALLELLKAPVERQRPQGMNQTAIKDAILADFPWRGLSDRNIQKIFSAANKAKEAAE